ncbi:MAG TPA: hypothetical protein VH120_15505 [Gemmataceae bacterium]|nr:hypothetical protein [Gemmataceae bacterium]
MSRYALIPAVIVLTAIPPLFAEPPAHGVLLLDNHHVLQGEIEKVGDQFRIRRDGGSTVVPASRVLAELASVDAAYKFLLARTDAKNVDARLKLARWCEANGLRTQATTEAQAAAALAPGRAVVQAAAEQFQHLPQAPPKPPGKLPDAILADAHAGEPIECSAEAFKLYTAKVQPILMNACASCHAANYTGTFHLERTFTEGLTSRPATLRNLSVVLVSLDRTRPAASPLLQKAMTAHGGNALPPIRGRNAPAYKHLDEWVRLVLEDVISPPAPEPKAEAASATVPAGPEGKTEFGSAKPAKEEPNAPKDPFDPVIFNRKNHPDDPNPKR